MDDRRATGAALAAGVAGGLAWLILSSQASSPAAPPAPKPALSRPAPAAVKVPPSPRADTEAGSDLPERSSESETPDPETAAAAKQSQQESKRGPRSDYGFTGATREAYDRYHRTPAASLEREVALADLAMGEEPEILRFLFDQYEKSDAEARTSLIEAVVRFGSRDAVSQLRTLAEHATAASERAELIEAAEYLALPSLTEVLRDRARR